jgi:uncharacterized protein (TIGR02145 family)
MAGKMAIKRSIRFLALSLLACAALSGQATGVFKDPRDGRIYKTVKIGDQVWFAENLAYKADAGCWAYEDRESNVAQFGRLYTFAAANKVCPPGWHLPSKQEFETLLRHIGGNGLHAYQELIPSGSSGFAGLFAGFRTARFEYQGKIGHFWSSTAINVHSAWYLGITSFVPDAGLAILDRVQDSHNKVFGFSVRPLKNKKD